MGGGAGPTATSTDLFDRLRATLERWNNSDIILLVSKHVRNVTRIMNSVSLSH